MALLIIFDVAPRRLAQLVDAVKELGAWGELTPSSYLVDSRLAPGEVMERLHPNVAPNESLWVVTAASPWASYGDPIVEDHAELLGSADDWTVWDWDDASSSRPKGKGR